MTLVIIIVLLLLVIGLYEYNLNKQQRELDRLGAQLDSLKLELIGTYEIAEVEFNAKERRKKVRQPLVKQRKKK
jgi:hypothetical protein